MGGKEWLEEWVVKRVEKWVAKRVAKWWWQRWVKVEMGKGDLTEVIGVALNWCELTPVAGLVLDLALV